MMHFYKFSLLLCIDLTLSTSHLSKSKTIGKISNKKLIQPSGYDVEEIFSSTDVIEISGCSDYCNQIDGIYTKTSNILALYLFFNLKSKLLMLRQEFE
jgi:hypothetical protein